MALTPEQQAQLAAALRTEREERDELKGLESKFERAMMLVPGGLGLASTAAARERGGADLGAYVRRLGHGLTYNWDDEARAGMGSGSGDNYEERRADLQAQKERDIEATGLAGTVLEMVGSAVTPMKLAKPLFLAKGKVVKNIPGKERFEPSRLASIGKAVLGGSVAGGIYGAGSSEPGNRLWGAAVDGATGASMGPVGLAAGNLARPIANYLAERAAAQALDVPRKHVGALRTAVESDLSGGKPIPDQEGLRLVDLGPKTRAQTDEVAMKADEDVRMAVRDYLKSRSMNVSQDVRSAIDETVAVPQGMNRMDEALRSATRPKTDELYKAAYERSIQYGPSPEEVAAGTADMANHPGILLERLLKERIEPKVHREAVRKMRIRGEKSKQRYYNLDTDTMETLPDVRQIDHIKRALDSEIGIAKQKGDREEVSMLTNLKNEMLGYVDELVPEFGQARQAASMPLQAIEAMQLGHTFANRSFDDFRADFEKVKPEYREFVARGIAEYMDENIARANRPVGQSPGRSGGESRTAILDREAVKAIESMSTRNMQDKLELALGSERAAQLSQAADRAKSLIQTGETLEPAVTKEAKKEINELVDQKNWLDILLSRDPDTPGGVLPMTGHLMEQWKIRSPQDARIRRNANQFADTMMGPMDPWKVRAFHDAMDPMEASRRAGMLARGVVAPAVVGASMPINIFDPRSPRTLWQASRQMMQ